MLHNTYYMNIMLTCAVLNARSESSINRPWPIFFCSLSQYNSTVFFSCPHLCSAVKVLFLFDRHASFNDDAISCCGKSRRQAARLLRDGNRSHHLLLRRNCNGYSKSQTLPASFVWGLHFRTGVQCERRQMTLLRCATWICSTQRRYTGERPTLKVP